MPVGYPTNAFFYKGEWYNTDGEGVPAMAITNTLTGEIVKTLYVLTQTEYDAIVTKDPSTLYLISGA